MFYQSVTVVRKLTIVISPEQLVLRTHLAQRISIPLEQVFLDCLPVTLVPVLLLLHNRLSVRSPPP